MKINFNCDSLFKDKLKKILLVLLLASVGNIYNPVMARTQQVKLTLSYENASLLQIIGDLRAKTDLNYLYKSKDVENIKGISFSVKECSLSAILNLALSDTGLSYLIDSELVYIQRTGGKLVEKQQKEEVKGRVTDDKGNPMPGVSVVVKGTNSGTATDVNGGFALKYKKDMTIVISFMGMETQEVKIPYEQRNKLWEITLKEKRVKVDEVVVTGYGTKKRNEFTGSITTVKSEKLEQVPVPSVEQALQGNVAGLSSVSVNGQPGAAQEIRIRGVGSISASSSPLYVIDGVPVVSGDFSRNTVSANILAGLSSNDIESINVLKDASATSVYGARGANGVIVITTKSGRQGEAKINVDFEYGFNDMTTKGPDRLNTKEWQILSKEAMENGQYGSYIGSPQFPTYKELMMAAFGYPNWDSKTDTDWDEVILRDKAKQTQLGVSVQGGNNKNNYFTSFNYFNQESIVKGSDFNRLSGLMNLNNRITEKFSVQSKLNVSYSETNSLVGGGGFANPILARIFLLPVDKAYNKDGSIYVPESGYMMNGLYNPAFIQENEITMNKTMKLIGNVQGFYRPIENLKYTVKIAGDYFNIEENQYQNPIHGDGRDAGGRSFSFLTRNFNWVFQNMVDYNLVINDDHKFDFKLLYEAQKNKVYTADGYSERTPKAGFLYQAAYAKPMASSSSFATWTAASAMFNFNYKFKDKVYVDGTYRREGSSRFSPENRYGNFWSLGISYNLYKEDFFKNITFLSSLNVRTSYGVNGNAGIPSNLYMAGVSYAASYNDYPVSYVGGIDNPDLTWEKNKPFNVGIDFGLFNSRLSGTIDYFQRVTSDLLLAVPQSATDGRISVTKNVGEMKNSGFEFSFTSHNIKGDFNWITDFNLTYVKNEVTKIYKLLNGDYADISSNSKLIRVGENIETIYMKKWAGVDSKNGDALWYINGKDGKTTNDYNRAKQEVQGKSTPDFFGGLTNTLSYKGFSLSFQLNYMLNYQILDSWANYTMSDGAFTCSYGGYKKLMDRWQKPGDVTDVPKNIFNNPSQSNNISTRYMFDGDHIRLRNLTLNYDLPKSLTDKMKVNSFSIYARGTNLFTYCFDSDLEFDPEVDSSGFIDFNIPMMKSITVGLKIRI